MTFSSHAQLTIVVDGIPANTPDNSNIHIAGNFQSWDPSDPAFVLEENIEGNFEIIINPPEGNKNGGFTLDRTFL